MLRYNSFKHDTYEDALPRFVQLLAYRLATEPPQAVRLKDLREELGLSQEEVGRRLGKKQASISRAESRSDFHVSTLQDFAEAFGAKLVVKMVFPDLNEKELQFLDGKLELEATK